jgi:hypothetical protein
LNDLLSQASIDAVNVAAQQDTTLRIAQAEAEIAEKKRYVSTSTAPLFSHTSFCSAVMSLISVTR